MSDTYQSQTPEYGTPATVASPRIELRRTRDFGATINVVFAFLKQNLRPLGRSILFIVGPALIVSTVVGGVAVARLIGNVSEYESKWFNSLWDFYGGSLELVALSMAAGILTTIFLFAVVVGYVRLYVDRAPESITVDDVWNEVKDSFGRVTSTLIVTLIVCMLPLLVLMIPAILSGSVVVIVLAVFAAVIPTVYLYTCLSITIPMRMEEDIGLFASVSRSLHLVKGRWWATFWIFVLMTVVVTFASTLFQVPLQVVMSLSMFTGEAPSIALIAVAAVLSTIGTYLLYSILVLTCSVQYYNLVEGKEGVGMVDRINSIGGESNFGAVTGESTRV